MLEACGHAAWGAQACIEPEIPDECDLTCCGESGAAPDVAMLAVLGPRHCTGVTAALKARVKWPGARILLISASPMEIWPAAERERLSQLPESSYGFLQKPFALGDLRDAVGRLLGAG